MAEEPFRAKLPEGFGEGRIRVRPQLWYHGVRLGTKNRVGYEGLNVLG